STLFRNPQQSVDRGLFHEGDLIVLPLVTTPTYCFRHRREAEGLKKPRLLDARDSMTLPVPPMATRYPLLLASAQGLNHRPGVMPVTSTP
ncbi:MAG: hypothetical protein AAFY56_04960, partial [Pseudomonadota bacterium]